MAITKTNLKKIDQPSFKNQFKDYLNFENKLDLETILGLSIDNHGSESVGSQLILNLYHYGKNY